MTMACRMAVDVKMSRLLETRLAFDFLPWQPLPKAPTASPAASGGTPDSMHLPSHVHF